MNEEYDVAVIGSGPGGYIAAIRAAQLGFRVACIEKWKNSIGENVLGGTCLNVGCIPSKALLASSECYENTRDHISIHGIKVSGLSIDVDKMQARKNKIVKMMTSGIAYLFKKNKIVWKQGHAKFLKKEDESFCIEVNDEDHFDKSILCAKYVIIATGSEPRKLDNVTVDNTNIVDNEGALNFIKIPKKIAVIGAGVIGVELGSVWRRLGSEVTLLESGSSFLPSADSDISEEALKIFTKQGLKFEFGIKIHKCLSKGMSSNIDYTDSFGSKKSLEVENIIVAVGRKPYTQNLGLENIGLSVNEKGFIDVNHQCETKVKNVFAIGDVIGGAMLAHKAEDEGVLVAEIISGQKPSIDYNCIPWVIYTSPEIAWVGQNEKNLKKLGVDYKIGKIPFFSNGRAQGIGSTNGFIKMIACAKTDKILGVHIIAENASDLIAEAVVTMEFQGTSEDICRICHPHPSLSEVMREAALACNGRALNA